MEATVVARILNSQGHLVAKLTNYAYPLDSRYRTVLYLPNDLVLERGDCIEIILEPASMEMKRREEAQAHAGEVVSGSGKRGKPRRMAQMVSVRLDGELLDKLKAVAEQRDLSLSELLREGAELIGRNPRPTETRTITETKNVNVMRPNEEAAKRWANKIKREKEEQKER